MKKNKFLALTMLCSVLSGVSANAQEVKNSGSQTTGEVKNSSGNKGTSNSDKDVKKGDKEVTKDKAKDSGEVGWEDFKKRFGDRVSSFVDLVKRHPVWSFIIGIGGGITIREGVRRTCFKPKNNNLPHGPEPQPHGPEPQPHGPHGPQLHGPVIPPHGPMIQQQPHGPMIQQQPVEIWGVNKFGYNEQEDCIYRNPNEKKIRVILVGSNKALKSMKTDILVQKLKEINGNAEEQCRVSEDRINDENLEEVRLSSSTSADELVKKSKENECCFVLFVYQKKRPEDFKKYDNIDWKANVSINNQLYEKVKFCNVSDFATNK